MIRLIPLLGAGLGALAIGACAVADPPATPASIPPTAAPEPTPTAGPLTPTPPRPLVFDLSETHVLRGGFSIAQPAGWTAEPRGPYLTTITELERDRDRGPLGPIDGYQVTFERLPAENFSAELSAGGMLGLYVDKGFEVSGEREELSVFGAPALQLAGTFPTSGRAVRCLMGVASEEEVFALCIGAPSPGEVDNFSPTWDRMLASITPVAAAPREFLLSEIRRIPAEDLTITHPSGWRATSHTADGRRHTAIVDPAAEYVISIYTRPASDDELRSKAAMAVGWRTDPIIQVRREVEEVNLLGEPAFRIKGNKDGVIFETGLKPALKSILDSLAPEMFAAHEKYNCLLTVLRRSGLPLLHEICVYAPTWRALDAFMPTWDRMIDSIKPVGK